MPQRDPPAPKALEWRAERHSPNSEWWLVVGLTPNGSEIICSDLTEDQARLIAAAPDLAKALELYMSGKIENHKRFLGAARTALQKAGRGPK